MTSSFEIQSKNQTMFLFLYKLSAILESTIEKIRAFFAGSWNSSKKNSQSVLNHIKFFYSCTNFFKSESGFHFGGIRNMVPKINHFLNFVSSSHLIFRMLCCCFGWMKSDLTSYKTLYLKGLSTKIFLR